MGRGIVGGEGGWGDGEGRGMGEVVGDGGVKGGRGGLRNVGDRKRGRWGGG